MIKPSKVVFISDELEKDFNSLKEDDPIKKAMIRAIQDLKENAFSEIQIPKRLLYTIAPNNEAELISAILEWFDHKDYERRFGY